MLIMLTVLVLSSIISSITFIGTADKRRSLEVKPVNVK